MIRYYKNPNGIYLSLESSRPSSSNHLVTPDSLLGQVDYARRLTDNRSGLLWPAQPLRTE